MTATQVLFLFFKECCTIDEMRFFKHTILKDNGNKYFRKRPLYTPTFVEDYLARNERALNNYMTRLFILAPNLKNYRHKNPRWMRIVNDFKAKNEGKVRKFRIKDWFGNYTGEVKDYVVTFQYYNAGMYINYYKRKWNQFLREKIESEKKFNSPFKKGESYEFKLKTNDSN